MTPIRIEGVTKRFGETLALDDVDLEVEEGEIFFLLGPSGCGKTTLLRIVAGLESADGGKVLFGEKDVTNLAASKREAVMVFQSYALWPHMSVEKNVRFGLDVRGVAKAEKDAAVKEALERVELTGLAQRKPGQLSGGQQQRVALARALVVKPRVLLLDEPLSNLDAGLRMQMRTEIRRLTKEAGLTALYVTHDQHEAMAVADRIALMRSGVVEQVGTPRRIYERPANRFAAQFMGETNLFEAKVLPGSDPIRLGTAFGEFVASELPGSISEADTVMACVRPESWDLSRDVGNCCAGKVTSATFLGERYEMRVDVSGHEMKVWTRGEPGSEPGVGDEVSLGVDPRALMVLPWEDA